MEQENYTILYVDDEKANLEAFKSLFRRKFNIVTVNSGRRGLEVLETQPVDLIISDQRMPGMPGIEFLKKVIPLFYARFNNDLQNKCLKNSIFYKVKTKKPL